MTESVIVPSTPPNSIYKRMSHASCLRLLLTEWVGQATINRLPDEILLHIFYFDRVEHYVQPPSWRWRRLVHVCRRWRSVGFASPNFLHLRLVCGPRTRVELTCIWPPVPIVIRDELDLPMPEDYNFVAAIVDPNRVYEIDLCNLKRTQLQRLASEMQGQFPSLIYLKLSVHDHSAAELPDEFLGRSAPRLHSLKLCGIAFHALPRFLLSTTDLVHLSLWNIPRSAYSPPEVIVSGLAVLVNLKHFTMGFSFSLSDADRRSLRPPPLTHAVLPALTSIEFLGVGEYLENFVARIDAPLVGSFRIGFTHWNRLIFDFSQLARFMRRSTKIGALDEAHATVRLQKYAIRLRSLPPNQISGKTSGLTISCQKKDWRLSSASSLAQALTSFFPFIYMFKHLYIQVDGSQYSPSPSRRHDAIDNRLWLEIFRLFPALKILYVCKEFAECNAFALALQDLAEERGINTLPALESLSLEELQPTEPVQEAIEQFVAARQLLGHPVAVSQWDREME